MREELVAREAIGDSQSGESVAARLVPGVRRSPLMTHRYRLAIEYEGTRYRGWQEQKNARTVAGELRRALEEVVGAEIEVSGAGRTDAGVHAMEQIAHVTSRERFELRSFAEKVNERLPADIHLLDVRAVGSRFHARHDALLRSYVYQVALRRTALAKRFVWWVRSPLDLSAMERAATLLVGRHDFCRFCERPAEATSTLVVVERAEIVREGELALFRIAASHFLWKMVRRLIGALVAVGAGELESSELAKLLEGETGGAGKFRPAEHTAPPSGLFLERVVYAGDPPLAPLRSAVPVPARRAG